MLSTNRNGQGFPVSCRRSTKVLLLLAASALAGCSALKPVNLLNAAVPSSGYRLNQGVVYGELERQELDIYYPTTPAANSRIIVFVYGGAWRQGNRKEYKFVGQALADAGHTVVIPDYRLYPSVIYPEFVNDVVDAIKVMMVIIEEETARPANQIVLMGHSSGAHTAALLASDPGWLEETGVTVDALVAIAGPYDLPLDDPEVAPVFRSVSSADEARPVALATPLHPPTLLVHGDDDERVLPFHTRHYSAALQAAGVPVTVHWLEGGGHVSSISGIAAPLDFSNRNRERITEFLDGL